MLRALLLALLCCLAALPAAAAEPAPAPSEALRVLDPGPEPVREARRRAEPLGTTGAGLAGLMLVAMSLLARRLHRDGREMASRVCLSLAAFALVWAVAEVGLYLTADRWRLHVKIRSGCYASNPRGYFQRSTWEGDPSSWAFCAGPLTDVWATCEAPSPPRPPGTLRVLAVGDSFTDGVGVFARDTWPAQLQRRLRARLPKAEVVNCGHADLDALGVAERFRTHVARHDPNLVLYAFVLNDVPGHLDPTKYPIADISFQLETRQAYARWIDKNPAFGALSRGSALGRFFLERWMTAKVARTTEAMYRAAYADPNAPALQKALDAIAAMRDESFRRGAHFLVILWPLIHRLDHYPFAQAHQTLREALQAREIPVLDLLPTFRGKNARRLQVHPTDHHPNELAHALAAQAIAQDLQRRAWLTK